MRIFNPRQTGTSDVIITAIIDFGPHDGQPYAFQRYATMADNFGYIESVGWPYTDGGPYNLTEQDCCLVLTRGGRTYVASRQGVNERLLAVGQDQMIELDES